MRDLHTSMLAALLDGEGLQGVAELAAAETGSPIAIVLPARSVSAASDERVALGDLERAAAALLEDPEAATPDSVALHVPVEAGDRTVGFAFSIQADKDPDLPAVDQGEVLRTVALATLTEIAVGDARDELAGELRGSLFEDLRSRAHGLEGAETARRAARLGCDVSHGALALVAEIRSARPGHAAALITGEHLGAIAEALPAADPGPDEATATRIYALLPAREGDATGAATLESARRLTARLRPHGPAAFSSFCERPEELGRAVAEAELMLDVIARDERIAEQLTNGIGNGVYRLLFRALAGDPDEVRRFFEDTVEPLVSHDGQYRTDLLGTLESYLANDCNMNATARAVYAHRHTVAHRLARVRELTGLDPGLGEDRERLGLGIKAYRILQPTLPR